MGLTDFSFLFCLKVIFFILFIIVNICLLYCEYQDRKYNNKYASHLKSGILPELKKIAKDFVYATGVFFEYHINNLTVFLTEFTVRFSIFGCIFEQLYSLTVYTGCVAQSVFSFYDYCTGILMDFSLMDYSLMGCSIVVLCGISIIVVSFIYHYTKDIFINLSIFTFFGFSFFVVSYIVLYIGCIGSNFINSCGISTIVGYIILYSGAGRKIIDEIRKNAGNIGTGAVGLATGLDAVLNLADRFKGDKGDKGGGSSGSGSGESDSGGSGDSGSDKNNESDKKDNNTKDTDKKENTDSTENKTANNKN